MLFDEKIKGTFHLAVVIPIQKPAARMNRRFMLTSSAI
jgi:hypothetical protein